MPASGTRQQVPSMSTHNRQRHPFRPYQGQVNSQVWLYVRRLARPQDYRRRQMYLSICLLSCFWLSSVPLPDMYAAKSAPWGVGGGVMSPGIAGSARDPQALHFTAGTVCPVCPARRAGERRRRLVGGGRYVAGALRLEGVWGTGQRQPRAAIMASSSSGAHSSALPLIRRRARTRTSFLVLCGPSPGRGSASGCGSFQWRRRPEPGA